jgi:hypothetical protein
MPRQTEFGWQTTRSRHWPLPWIALSAAVVLAVAYVSVGEIDDPVVALAQPPKIDVPAKKPARAPILLERVHILNSTPEQRGSLPTRRLQQENGPASYSELRREFTAN